MATVRQFNKNNSAVKRIMQEARELANDPSTEYSAAPLDDNIFEWHCTIRGPKDSEFEGGLYHLRILLPAEYPFRAPSLLMLTPSGRFETNTKICISFTNYHEEDWQPAWGVRTVIIGLQGFFGVKGSAAVGVGSMDAPASERRRLAKLSPDWICSQCNRPNHESLPSPSATAEMTQTESTASSSRSELKLSEQQPSSDANSKTTAGTENEVRQDLHVNKEEVSVERDGLKDTGDTSYGASREIVAHSQSATAAVVEVASSGHGDVSSDSDLSPAEGPAAVAPLHGSASAAMAVTVGSRSHTNNRASHTMNVLRKRMVDDSVGLALDATISVLVALALAIVMRKLVLV